jgi:hypothetical protein
MRSIVTRALVVAYVVVGAATAIALPKAIVGSGEPATSFVATPAPQLQAPAIHVAPLPLPPAAPRSFAPKPVAAPAAPAQPRPVAVRTAAPAPARARPPRPKPSVKQAPAPAPSPALVTRVAPKPPPAAAPEPVVAPAEPVRNLTVVTAPEPPPVNVKKRGGRPKGERPQHTPKPKQAPVVPAAPAVETPTEEPAVDAQHPEGKPGSGQGHGYGHEKGHGGKD